MNMLIHQCSGKRAALRMALLLGTLACAASAQAIDVSFTGKLIDPPPCVINGNTDISVDFGNDMLAGRIDGVNYERPINFTLDCTKAAAINRSALKLQFLGDPATAIKPTTLATTKTDLAIELRRDGGLSMPLNTWVHFDYPAVPTFTAVPIKAVGSTLNGGTFTAAATLLVDYQ